MVKFLATIKAILTRLVFGCHGFIAIWQVTIFKKDPFYWYLAGPIVLLLFEGFFTLIIKTNQEWKWFCPSVFLYLTSIVPSIWLLELDKLERRMKSRHFNLSETLDLSNLATEDLKHLEKAFGVNLKLPELQISRETWVTLIEQFLMLVLIIGRWMLPKGDLTRDQLSQLLLVYIGTAADIIEFFDSFKEDKIGREWILVYLTLGIWSWSLIQFTVVLTATKSRKSRLSSGTTIKKKVPTKTSCCSIDVWAIALNMILQDAPFLAFRLIIIIHYQIVSYMNIFFTCKNTLVIVLQLYRLYVVQSENKIKTKKHKKRKLNKNEQLPSISIISYEDAYKYHKKKKSKNHGKSRDIEKQSDEISSDESSSESSDNEKYERKRKHNDLTKKYKSKKKDYKCRKNEDESDQNSNDDENYNNINIKSKKDEKKRLKFELKSKGREKHSKKNVKLENSSESSDDSNCSDSEFERRYKKRKNRHKE